MSSLDSVQLLVLLWYVSWTDRWARHYFLLYILSLWFGHSEAPVPVSCLNVWIPAHFYIRQQSYLQLTGWTCSLPVSLSTQDWTECQINLFYLKHKVKLIKCVSFFPPSKITEINVWYQSSSHIHKEKEICLINYETPWKRLFYIFQVYKNNFPLVVQPEQKR